MERKEEISLRDSGWSRLKRVMAWIRGDLMELERRGQCRVCDRGAAMGLLMPLKGGRRRRECEQLGIDPQSWTAS